MSDLIIIDITKAEAYELMLKGHKIRHRYYEPHEYLYMQHGMIYTEEGYPMGGGEGNFWRVIQKWEQGWETANAA